VNGSANTYNLPYNMATIKTVKSFIAMVQGQREKGILIGRRLW
jgi:hypothetical protein